MKLKLSLALIVLYQCISFATVSISGEIFDIQTNSGVSGATISIVGTNLSTQTFSDGSFTISNVSVFSTGFQIKASKSGYVNTYSQLGNVGAVGETDISFPVFSNTMYSNLHSTAFGGVAHTSGKGDIVGMVNSGNKEGVSGVVITARYIDNNQVAGIIRYVNESMMPDPSLTSTSSSGAFIVYNVDPYKPVKIIGTKSGSNFSSCVVICYPDSVTVGGIEGISLLPQLTGTVTWDDNPVSGATVSIPGTTFSTTTGNDGSFSISFHPTAYGVIKVSKQNYVDTYVSGRADEVNNKNGDEGFELFIIPQAVYNDMLASLGKSHISGKGDIYGSLKTANDLPVAGAKINLYDKNGTKLNPDIFYFDEQGNPETSLKETTSESQFLIINLDPGYYFISAEKNGFEFGRNLAIVFANGIAGVPDIISYPPMPGIEKQKFEDIPSANISAGAQNVAMLSFILNLMKWETDENVVFDSVIVTAKGTGNISTALSSAKLYLDADNNGTYETLVSTGTISGNKIIFSNINREMDYGVNQKYLVVFNFNGTASVGQTFGVDILKNSDVSSHAKNSLLPVTCEGEPIEGNLMTIVPAYPPAKPMVFVPPDGTNPLAYAIQSSPFDPGQGNTTHKASQWRIWKEGESYETLTWDSGEDTVHLTYIYTPVPLEGYTIYYCQVRYENGDNVWSEWSDAGRFLLGEGGITPPQAPTNQSPSNEATDVKIPVTLQASSFVPGSSNTHIASQWRIYKSGSNEIVFDTKRDTTNLTSIIVSSLLPSTQYYWTVRYQDGNGAWSNWSEPTTFTTIQGIKGNLNGDSEIDISDVILCLRMAIGLPVTISDQTYNSPYPDWLIYLADMNNDGVVDISDVILILRKAIGLD